MDYRDLLSRHNITDINVLSQDTKDFIKELTALEKSKLPTIKKDGVFTEAAARKSERLQKVICDGIIDYVEEMEDQNPEPPLNPPVQPKSGIFGIFGL